jgi:hypothetical protein
MRSAPIRVVGLVNFEQTHTLDRILDLQTIMAIPKDGKYEDYVRYATHCLDMMPRTTDRDARAINREMAAEWLKLADAVVRKLKRTR